MFNECFLCECKIKINKDSDLYKLPCCKEYVHQKCLLDLSAKKWRRMAVNRKYEMETCFNCKEKMSTPLERIFMALCIAVKMIKKQLDDNSIEVAKDSLGTNWKAEVYNIFGESMLKNQSVIESVRNSKISSIESISIYMIRLCKSIISGQTDLNIGGSNNMKTDIITEDQLPDDLVPVNLDE